MTRPVCAHCGVSYGRRVTTTERVTWPANQPMPRYEGNGVVTKTSTPGTLTLRSEALAERARRRNPLMARDEPELDPRFYCDEPTMYAYRETWDGESWGVPYDPFCTLRCALSYARKAYNRVKTVV